MVKACNHPARLRNGQGLQPPRKASQWSNSEFETLDRPATNLANISHSFLKGSNSETMLTSLLLLVVLHYSCNGRK